MVKLLKESQDKKWLNVELTSDEYKKLKKFLVDHEIKHEASGAYNLIHVKVYVDEYERQQIDDFLSTLDEGCHGRKRKSTKKRKSVKEDVHIYDAYGVYISSPEESYVIWSRDKNNAKRTANYISKLTKDPYFDPYEEADTLEELCFMVQDDMKQKYGMNLHFNDVSEIEMSNDVISVDGDNLINILKYFDFGY